MCASNGLSDQAELLGGHSGQATANKKGNPFTQVGEHSCYRGYALLREMPCRDGRFKEYLVEKEGSYYLLILSEREIPEHLEYFEQLKQITKNGGQLLSAIFELGYDSASSIFYQVQEYLPLGSFHDYMQFHTSDEPTLSRIVRGLALSLSFLHENGITHGALNPLNLVLRYENPLQLLISGIPTTPSAELYYFIFARTEYQRQYLSARGQSTCSPEEDWWSVGALLLEYLTPLSQRKEMMSRLAYPELLDLSYLSEKNQSLLRGLWKEDISERWGAKELLAWCGGDPFYCSLVSTDTQHVPELPTVPPFAPQAKPVENPKQSIPDWPEDLHDLLPVRSPSLTQRPVREVSAGRFYFNNEFYDTLESIALAFASGESAWNLARTQLEELQLWLESRGQNQEAQLLMGLRSTYSDLDEVLFRLVHSHVNLPFIYKGIQIDTQQLYTCLEKMVTRSATVNERAIAELLDDSRLLLLHDTYAGLNQKSKPFLSDLLVFLRGKPPSDQWIYLSALLAPDTYIWPKGFTGSSQAEILADLKTIATLPINKAFLREIETATEIPENILTLLNERASYAIGAMRLRDLHSQSVFSISFKAPFDEMDRDDSLFSSESGRFSEPPTESVATLLLGTTPESTQKLEASLGLIEDIVSDIGTTLRSYEVFQLGHISEYLRQLKEKRFTPDDVLFVDEVSTLTGRYGDLVKFAALGRFFLFCTGAFLGLLLGMLAGGNAFLEYSTIFFFSVSVAVLLKKILLYAFTDDFIWVHSVGEVIYLPLAFIALPLAWWVTSTLGGVTGMGATLPPAIAAGFFAVIPASDYLINWRKRFILKELFAVSGSDPSAKRF